MTNTLQIKYSDKSDATLEKDELLRGEIALNIKDNRLLYRSASSSNESSDSVKSIPLLDEEELKQLIKDNAPQGLQYFEDSTWDSDEYKSVLLKPKNEESNTTVAIVPKGTGAFTLSDYGVKLGEKSVDLQIYNYSPVKTNYSVCTGGTGNNVNSDYSVICGGGWNTIHDSSQGFIGGGVSNSLRGWNSAILCGSNNEINGNSANFIANGKENKMLGLEWKKDKITEDDDPYHVHFSFIAGTDNTLQGNTNAIIGYNNIIQGDSYTYPSGVKTLNSIPMATFIQGFNNTVYGVTAWNTIIGSQDCRIQNTEDTGRYHGAGDHCAFISAFSSDITNSNHTVVMGSNHTVVNNSTEVFVGPFPSGAKLKNCSRIALLTGNNAPNITDSKGVFWPLVSAGSISNSEGVYVFSQVSIDINPLYEDTSIGNANISIHNAYSAQVRGSLNLFSSAFNFTSYNTASALLLNSDAVSVNGGSSIPSSTLDQFRDSQYNNVIGSRSVNLIQTKDILNLSSHAVFLGGAQNVALIQCDLINDNTSYNSTKYSSAMDIATKSTIYNSSIINSRQITALNSSWLSINSSKLLYTAGYYYKSDIENTSLAKLDCVIGGELKNGYSIEGFGPMASNLGMSNHSYRCMAEGTSIGTSGYTYKEDVPAEFALITGAKECNSNKKFQTGKVYLQLVMKEPDISKPTFMTKANYDSSNSKRPDATNASFIVVPDNGYMFFDFKADFVNGTSIVTIEMKNGVLHNDGSKIEVVRQPVVTSNDTSANSIQLNLAQIEQETTLDLKQVAFSVDSTLDASAFASGVFDYRLMY